MIINLDDYFVLYSWCIHSVLATGAFYFSPRADVLTSISASIRKFAVFITRAQLLPIQRVLVGYGLLLLITYLDKILIFKWDSGSEVGVLALPLEN